MELQAPRTDLRVLDTTDAWGLVFPGQPFIPTTFLPRPAFPSDRHWAFLPICFPSRYETLGVRSGALLHSSRHGPERLAQCQGFPGHWSHVPVSFWQMKPCVSSVQLRSSQRPVK